MLDAKYYKDLSHNYLILKSNNNDSDKYQIKMLTQNRIRYLLSCNIRSINEEIFFYYEISSKQSMESFYGRVNITYKQLLCLFEYLYEASKAVKEYLLPDNHLLLLPEFIYLNPKGEEYYFVYYPYILEKDMAMYPFAEFLVEKVDREDERAVETVYKIYELIQDEQFILSEILHLFDESDSNHQIDRKVQRNEFCTEAVSGPEPERESRGSIQAERREIDYLSESKKIEIDDEGEHTQYLTGNFFISLMLFILCIAGIIGIFSVRFLFDLSAEESVLTVAGIAVLVLAAILLLLSFILLPYKEGVHTKEEESESREEKMIQNTEFADMYMTVQSHTNKRNETYGNTVYIESSLLKRENKLYGTNKGNKYHIDLDKLPCTVGKMAGNVDIVIKDESISRMHARFSKKGEQICVTDLNSTNGTFKNGLRLEPNETMEIEPGDEVRFGKMIFEYR